MALEVSSRIDVGNVSSGIGEGDGRNVENNLQQRNSLTRRYF